MNNNNPSSKEAAFAELEVSVAQALETYSNVHRGTGYNSMASTLLYEQARNTVLNICGLDKGRYTVVFCSPARAAALEAAVRPSRVIVLSSRDLGLPLGLRAVIVRSGEAPKGVPFQTGGGTVRIASRGSVVWEDAPDRFEAGTPPVINAIAFAQALELARRFGIQSFQTDPREATSPRQILHEDDLKACSGRALLERLQRKTMGRGRLVPTSGGYLPYIHIDNAASTPTFQPVWNAVRRAWRLPAERQAELIAAVRVQCAGFFGAPTDLFDTIFTSNTTEAINIAAKALTRKPSRERPPEDEFVVLNTIAEHNSNDLPWRFAEGVQLIRATVDKEGFPNLKEIERLLREYNVDRAHGRKRIRIVSVSGASNVLGACPNLAEIGRIAHRYQAFLFVDAAQLAGHRAIRMAADGLDGLVFSGHKMYAPFGAGGLILKKGLWLAGNAAFESSRESGDENAAGVAALGKAIDLLERIGMDIVHEEELKLTRTALRELAAVPGIRIHGIEDPDSPRIAQRLGVISFELKRVPYNLLAKELAETAGLGVRAGCHCAHILVKRLLHMHSMREALANLGMKIVPRFTKSALPGLARISFGLANGEADVRRLVRTLEKISARRSSRIARFLAKTHNAIPILTETKIHKRMRGAIKREASSVFGAVPAGLADNLPQPPALWDRIPFGSITSVFPEGRACCSIR